MFGKISYPVEKKDARLYTVLSYSFYLLFFLIVLYGTINFLFPFIRYEFDFNNPNADKNTLFLPHLESFLPIEKGKISAGNTLSLYGHNPHILESITYKIKLNSKVNVSKILQDSQIIIQHGWAALFFPRDINLKKDAGIKVVEFEGDFYELKNDTLFPFVSENAALSHIQRELIPSISESDFAAFKKSDDLAGFRIGTLLAYADGVFIVTEDKTVRPFGSAKILLQYGYTFDHVLPANGEEVGIYTRGKIFLPGRVHPVGTLFEEKESGQMFVFENMKLVPLEKEYSDFLVQKNDVILFSEDDLQKKSDCFLKKEFLRNAFSCTAPINFSGAIGEDYQISLENKGVETDVSTLSVGMQASQDWSNARFVIKFFLERVVQRIGIQ